MKVIITGASGFIGTSLLKYLSSLGVCCLGVSRKPKPGLHTVLNYEDTPSGDVLIHLAEINNRSIVNTQNSNYEATSLKTLDQLLRNKYSKVIYASSSIVYSDKSVFPRIESDPVHITDAYSRLKLLSEKKVLENNGIVARISNVYGAKMPPYNVISDILGQLEGQAPLNLKNVYPIRDFVHINDVCESFYRLAINDVSGIFNVGTGIGTSIGELAKLILSIAGQPTRPIISSQVDPIPSCITLDPSKSLKMLELKPCIPLKDGLKALLKLHIAKTS